MYRDKLSTLCQEAQRKFGTQLIIDTVTHAEEKPAVSLTVFILVFIYLFQEEEDFFAQDFGHTSASATSLSSDAYIADHKSEDSTHGPSVDHLDSSVAVPTSAPVSVILKKPIKKATLGAKKNALGAQKVRINFDEIEQRAAEKERQTAAEVAANKLAYQTELDGKKKSDDAAALQKLSAKFAMQDIDAQRKQMEVGFQTNDIGF